MQVTLRFHKLLTKFTNGVDSITVNVTSYCDAVTAAANMFPDLENYFRTVVKDNFKEEALLVSDGKVVPMDEVFFKPKKEITLVPIINGGGGNGGLIAGIIIIAAVALSFFTGGASLGLLATSSTAGGATLSGGAIAAAGSGAAAAAAATTVSLTTLGQLALSIGFSLVLSGLAPKPKINNNQQKVPDSGARTENNAYGSLANSTDSRSAIGIIYGMHRIGGQFVSGYIKTKNHGKTDMINVGEEF